MIDARKLQARLGVKVDGNLGPVTFAALFARMGAKATIAAELGLAASVHFPALGILENGLRLAHFIGQLTHESDGLVAMEEYASGAAYEGRLDLGNTKTGDGTRYKGRGPIQLTGRANYTAFALVSGIDCERRPDLVAIPSIGLWASCWYWTMKGLNALADADDLKGITRAVNGGYKGLEQRIALTAKAKALIL